MHTWLFTLSQKKTNCYPFTHHTWIIWPHYLVKCKTFSSDWLKVMLRSTTLCWNSAKTRPYCGLVGPTESLTVSKLGCTKLIFIEPWAKINGQYYRDVLLTQKLLSAIRSIAGDMFVFQQDNAPAHRARDIVELLCCETPHFISPCGKPTVLTLTR